MPRRPNPVPAYRLHKPSGQAVVTVRGPDGTRRDLYLGRFNSPESKAEYARLVAELQTAPAAGQVAPGPAPHRPTVNEVLLAFLKHADAYYRHPDGSPTKEPTSFREALRPVRELYGHTPAAEFGPLALKAVRQRMVESGLCRPVVNRRVNRVRRVWKWAASEELVPAAVVEALRTVAGLQKGRTAAPEPPPVLPADPAAVAATLPRLSRQLAALARVQALTGMRPGEACRLRPCDIDRSGDVWTYTPPKHKTLHRGKARRVKVGPQAQAVLAPFLAGDPELPVFSPRQAVAERLAALRVARKSKVQPSQVDRSKPNPVKLPGLAYTPGSYAQAVRKAAARAGVAHWHPNQLRHTFATEVRKAHGLEAAQVLLGHSRADVTQVYAERDDALADRVAREVG